MIYTITFNPSLDFIVTLEDKFNNSGVNRINTNGLSFETCIFLNDSKVINFLSSKVNNQN